MGIILDVVIVLILVLNVYLGYKKGLIKVAFSLFAFIIAIFVTAILFNPIANYIIKNTEFDENIKKVIISNFNKDTNDEKKENNNEDELENNSEANERKVKEKNNNIITSYINEKIKDIAEDAKESIIEKLAMNLSEKIVKVIVAIALFITIRILIILLKFLFEFLSELPIVKQFDKAGGVLYGLLKSVLIIYIFLTVLFVVNSVKNSDNIQNLIDTSYITKFLYDNNAVVDYCLLDKNLL